MKEYYGLKKAALEAARLPLETKKTSLEVNKLEREESRVRLATDEEIKTFDGVTAELYKKIMRDSLLYSSPLGYGVDYVGRIAELIALAVVIGFDRFVKRLQLMVNRLVH